MKLLECIAHLMHSILAVELHSDAHRLADRRTLSEITQPTTVLAVRPGWQVGRACHNLSGSH